MSILLPDSSSTTEKEDAQFKKQNKTSIVSRCAFGKRQQDRCNTRLRVASSLISARLLALIILHIKQQATRLTL